MLLTSIGSGLLAWFGALGVVAPLVQDEGPPSESVEVQDEDLEAVRATMAAAAKAQEAEDLEQARRLVAEAVEQFADLGDENAMAVWKPLDDQATALGMLPEQLSLREQVHEIRERLLPADHQDLLATKHGLAVTRYQLGDLAGAHELFEQVHEAKERLLPPDHPGLLTAKLSLAVTRKELGDLAGALALEEYAHDANERLLPPDHPRLLSAKTNLAGTRYKLGDLAGAQELFEQVHEARERLLPPDHPDLLTAKKNLAITRSKLGDLAGALALKEHVHAANERLLPPDDPRLLAAKLNLAGTRSKLGDHAGALALKEHVHTARERLLPPDHPDLLTAKQYLAGTRRALGDLAGAHVLFGQVHEARQRLLPPDHTALLNAKQNLAITRRQLGDLAGALALEEAVHAAWERLLPADHPDLLSAKQNLAITRKQLGDLAGALVLNEHVHEANERLLPADHPNLLRAKQNLAVTRNALADLAGAHELFEHVHEAHERLLPADHPDLLAAKQNLAVTRSQMGDLAGALALEEHVHAANERLLPPDHPHLLTAKLNLAGTRSQVGDHAGALALKEHVHTARERLLPPDHPDLLTAKQNLAGTRRALGDLEGAHELFEHVHAAHERLLPADHPDLLSAKQNLAATRGELGDLEGARSMVKSLLQGQLARSAALHGEAPRVARAAALDELDRFQWALFWGESTEPEVLDTLDAELFAVLESLRQVSTSSSAVALAAARLPGLAEVRDRLADARGLLNEHGLAPPEDEGQLDAWRKQLFELAEDRDMLEKELRVVIEEHGVFGGTISAKAVAESLTAGSAAVSFLRYQRHSEVDPDTGERPPAVNSMLAFVVEPDGSVQRVELGPASELEQLCERWRAHLGKPVLRGLEYEGDDESEEDVGRVLRARLIDPVLAALGAEPPASLHLVLDDFLLLVPIDALPWTDERRLGEVLDLRFGVSMQRLVAPPREVSGDGALLSLGGVSYGAEDIEAPLPRITTDTPPVRGSAGATPTSFKYLKQTEYEAEDLGRLFEEHFEAEPIVLLAEEATKQALMEHAEEARYLHLATHGWFAPETFTSMRDSAEQQGDDLTSLNRADETLRGFAPETLCGLALAGASHGRNSLGKVPGILTAEELATLDLSNCELAVLSACETNVGIRRAGQGIQSLQSALHAAGARTAITSLWKVDDRATRELMELFYTKLWEEKLGKAEALWQAKMEMREGGAALEDWAGWVLTGDPD